MEDVPANRLTPRVKMSERLEKLKKSERTDTEDLFQLINDFRQNWQRTRRSRTTLSRENSESDSQSLFDPIYSKRNRKIREFMRQNEAQIEELFPGLLALRNSGRHYFIWHPHWPVFRRLYGTKLRGFFVDNSMFANEFLTFFPELARFLLRLGVIRKLFKENEAASDKGPVQVDPGADAIGESTKKGRNQWLAKDPLTDAFVEEHFVRNFSKLELKNVMSQQLLLKPRFAKLVADFAYQCLFLHFGAAGLDKNISQNLMKKFLAGKFDSKSLLQTIRDFKYKGKYFIPVMAEDL